MLTCSGTTDLVDRDTNVLGRTVQAFLARPLDERCFDLFFRVCYAETMPYLRRLRSSGWNLPVNQMQQDNALADIAYDVLGPFLASKKNQPFFVIFDYFNRHELMKPEATPDTIAEHFRILLRGFVRKELTLICGLDNPQIKNLKRRIGDILTGSGYASCVFPGESKDCIFAVGNSENLSDERPPITRELLDRIVREAFQSSSNRTEWCAQIFQLMNQYPEVRAAIPKHQLVSTMVAVNAEYADAVGIVIGQQPTPREEHLRQTAEQAMKETLAWAESSVIAQFVAKGRLSGEDAPRVLKACRTYFEDLIRNGETDKIPQYFLAQKPGLSQSDYLKQHKYVMDTVANRVHSELRRRLREDPTIWPFGPYSPDEEP